VLWDHADTLVWLDYPRWLCELRVVRRSIVRGALRRPLWNGNHESLRRMVTDAEHPVRWSWSHYAEKRALVEGRRHDPRWSHLDVIDLCNPREAARWLASVSPAG
jgi:adenylate kinase family enzyme